MISHIRHEKRLNTYEGKPELMPTKFPHVPMVGTPQQKQKKNKYSSGFCGQTKFSVTLSWIVIYVVVICELTNVGGVATKSIENA